MFCLVDLSTFFKHIRDLILEAVSTYPTLICYLRNLSIIDNAPPSKLNTALVNLGISMKLFVYPSRNCISMPCIDDIYENRSQEGQIIMIE
jgi:hypothetical protein